MFLSAIIVNKQYDGINPIQFGMEDCAPDYGYGPAVRTFWILHFVRSGHGIFRRGGREYKLGAGDIFVIPPLEETYYVADHDDPWHYEWVGFSTTKEVPYLLNRPVIHCPAAGHLYEKMSRCMNYENGRSAYLCGCIWELLALFMEEEGPRDDYIRQIISCMQSEYSYGITVQEIARRLNLDRSYLSTLFRSKVGISPQQYLRDLRMKKAAELMTLQGLKPSAAATSTGYSDLYNFSKMFKQYYGVSPRAYIALFRRESAEEK